MLTTITASQMPWQTYGIFIIQTVVALGVVALVAWVVTRYGLGRFVRGSNKGRMKIVERLVLDPRRSVYLIEVDGKELLVGSGDGVRLLDKVETDSLRTLNKGMD